MYNLHNEIYNFSKNIFTSIVKQFKRAEIEEIIHTDGRKKLGHEGARAGSFIYLLFDKKDKLLYVGETGTSIKKRLIADGSGAHFVKNRTMFDEVKYIKYIRTEKDKGLSPMERKMIEQALTIYLKPKYYNHQIWKY